MRAQSNIFYHAGFVSDRRQRTHPVEVSIGVFRHVVVEYNIHALDIHTATEKICGHENALLEVFEGLVSLQAFLLRHAAVNRDGREVLVVEELSKGHAALHRPHEDDDLRTRNG